MNRRPAPSRWSVANVRRLVRGALNATTRADIRHGQNLEVELRLRAARLALLSAEQSLTLAMKAARRSGLRRAA